MRPGTRSDTFPQAGVAKKVRRTTMHFLIKRNTESSGPSQVSRKRKSERRLGIVSDYVGAGVVTAADRGTVACTSSRSVTLRFPTCTTRGRNIRLQGSGSNRRKGRRWERRRRCRRHKCQLLLKSNGKATIQSRLCLLEACSNPFQVCNVHSISYTERFRHR
jgi:hypothetical protein